MRGVPDVGRFFRVRLRLHGGWAIAFILITVMVVTQFAEAYALWMRVLLGVSAVLLFFAALGIREITLNFLALSRGIPEKRVTLFIFGGVAQLAEDETTPILEVLLAMAGLLANMIITGILYAIYSVLINTGSATIGALMLWSAFMYFMLSLFHFIPGFPLDGGRLVRAVLWKATGDYDRVTTITSWAGQGFGFLCIAGGILSMVLAHQWFNGMVLAFVGWVLQAAAMQSYRPVVLRRVLRGITARDVVAGDCPLISRELSISHLIHDYILVSGQRYFIVADGVRLEGIVSLHNIKKVPKKRRHSTTVGKIMAPASELRTARAKEPAASLLQQMNEWRIDYMPVLERGRVIGVVVRDALALLAKTRAAVGK
jgi:Zn-dependent protease